MSIGGVSESWARLRLVQGDSSAQAWELVASRDQTTLTIGSSANCSWVVREEGVKPAHFSLHWDGATLRVADTLGVGDVRVDGAVVGEQWRAIVGHARIDFGKAAMMVDTSAARAGDSDHPLDPGSIPPATSSEPPPEGPLRRVRKGTLLSAAALASELPAAKASMVPAPASVAPRASPSAAPAALGTPTEPGAGQASASAPPDFSAETGSSGSGGFRVSRFSESERARKATLLGVPISVPPAPPVPKDAPQAAASGAAQSPPGLSKATLMGVVGPLDMWAPRGAPGEAKKVADKRTILGMPMENAIARGPVGEGSMAALVTQAEVRTVSAPPSAPAERIASSWQEVPGSDERPSLPIVPTVDREGQGTSGVRPSDHPAAARHTPVRDSRPAKRPFPFHYLGIVALTAAAYFAWLYLLDHL